MTDKPPTIEEAMRITGLSRAKVVRMIRLAYVPEEAIEQEMERARRGGREFTSKDTDRLIRRYASHIQL